MDAATGCVFFLEREFEFFVIAGEWVESESDVAGVLLEAEGDGGKDAAGLDGKGEGVSGYPALVALLAEKLKFGG